VEGYEYFEGDKIEVCDCFDNVLSQYILLNGDEGVVIVRGPNKETKEKEYNLTTVGHTIPESEDIPEDFGTLETEIVSKPYIKLRYTNPVAQQIQDLLFSNNLFVGMVKLFLLFNEVHVGSDEEDGKFSIFNKHTKLWRICKQSRLYRTFSNSICNFITDHVRDLIEYKKRLSRKQWRYSEIYTTDCLNVNTVDKSKMIEWSYWGDAVDWQRRLLEKPHFALEDINDPTVLRSLCPDHYHNINLDNSHSYCSHHDNYDCCPIVGFNSNGNSDESEYVAGWNLADRYRHHYTYLFDRQHICQPRDSVPDDVIDDLKTRVDLQIADLGRIRRRLSKGLSMTRYAIIWQILTLASCECKSTISSNLQHNDDQPETVNDSLSNNNSDCGGSFVTIIGSGDNTLTREDLSPPENQCLIAIADQQVLDLSTLQAAPRTSEHNILSACKQQWFNSNSYSTEEVDTVLETAFDSSSTYLQLMSILGLALLDLAAPNKYLYIISCPQSVKTTLKALLSSTLGDLYGEGKTTTLTKDTLDAEDFAEFRGRQLVVFDTLHIPETVSEGVLKAYFNARIYETIGTKRYSTNTSFLLLTGKTPPIDKSMLRNYNSRSLIYYFKLDTLNADKLCNIKIPLQQDQNIKSEIAGKNDNHASRDNSYTRSRTIGKNKAAAITIAANTGLQHLFFISLVVSANICYNRIRDAEFKLPYLPEELLKTIATKPKPRKHHIYKHPTAKAAEKELFLDFMRSRVIIETGKEQSADEFRDNLYVYLDEVGGDPTSFTPSGLGKRLTNYLKDEAITDVTTNIREISGKTHRVYLGLQSYDYDLSA